MISQLKHLDFKGWIYGLLSAVIGGGSSAVTAAIAASIIKPGDFALASMDSFKLMSSVFLINGVISMFLYLKQSPLPPIVEDVPLKVPPIVPIIVLAAIILIPAAVQAQTPTEPAFPNQFFVAYIGVNSEAQTNPFGGGLYGRRLTGQLYSVSGYDVTAVPGQVMKVGGLAVPKMKFTQWTALGTRAFSQGPVSFWLKAGGGLASAGDNVTVAWNAGGWANIKFGKRPWGLAAGIDWIRDPISGDGYAIRIGPSWGK